MSVTTHARNHDKVPLLLLSATLALACGDAEGESGTTGASGPTGEVSDASDTAATSSATTGGTGGATTSATTPATTTSDANTSTSVGPTSAGTTTAAGSETDATTGDEPVEPDPRQDLLELYAPRIWFTANEEYWPSTVDWAFPYQTRFVASDNNHWLRSTDPLDSPSDELPWFGGDLDTAQVYGFYAEKMDGVLDLVYYVYSSEGSQPVEVT